MPSAKPIVPFAAATIAGLAARAVAATVEKRMVVMWCEVKRYGQGSILEGREVESVGVGKNGSVKE